MKISFGNIPQNWTEKDIEKLFSEFGAVESISIKKDKKLGVSLGFGSLQMDDASAKKAIDSLNGKEFEEKKIAVVDASDLQTDKDDKNKSKNNTSGAGKIHGSKTSGGFSGGGMVRRTGGGGRGK